MNGYLAFKMRGEPEFNFPWSHRVTAALRAQGHDVFNPAEFDEANGFDPTRSTAEPLAVYLEHDLAEVCRRDSIFLGRNWRVSVGACLECACACVLGKRVFEVSEHEGSCRDPGELSVALVWLDPSVAVGLAYQMLLPAVSA